MTYHEGEGVRHHVDEVQQAVGRVHPAPETRPPNVTQCQQIGERYMARFSFLFIRKFMIAYILKFDKMGLTIVTWTRLCL